MMNDPKTFIPADLLRYATEFQWNDMTIMCIVDSSDDEPTEAPVIVGWHVFTVDGILRVDGSGADTDPDYTPDEDCDLPDDEVIEKVEIADDEWLKKHEAAYRARYGFPSLEAAFSAAFFYYYQRRDNN